MFPSGIHVKILWVGLFYFQDGEHLVISIIAANIWGCPFRCYTNFPPAFAIGPEKDRVSFTRNRSLSIFPK